MPKAQFARALALQIREWSPYANGGHYSVPASEGALVWIWDEERLRAALQEQGLSRDRVRVIPETLLQPPLARGVVLRACLEGVDGQVWGDSALIASRWWPQTPDRAQWIAFQRDAAVSPEEQLHAVSAPVEVQWLGQPWAASEDTAESGAAKTRAEAVAIGVAATALALATTWYATSVLKFQQIAAARTAELRELEKGTEPVRLARSQALETFARVRTLNSLAMYPNQLSLMAAVAEKLPRNGPTMREWDFREGKLRVAIASPNRLESSEYVRALETLGPFENVQAALGNDSKALTLTMDVRPGGNVR